MYVDLLWVDESYRKSGFGSRILQALEECARSKNAQYSRLNTACFQGALEFYKKNGYKVFAKIEIFPENAQENRSYTDFFMRKTIVNHGADKINHYVRLKQLLKTIF